MQREPYRLVHSVSSKFREMNHKIGLFGGIFQYAWNNRKVVKNEDDETIFVLVVKRYTTKHEPWNYIRPYEILRKCEK
ncbi:hypothetical protein Hanom_Chr10g00917341 [Helianthus anomalus]